MNDLSGGLGHFGEGEKGRHCQEHATTHRAEILYEDEFGQPGGFRDITPPTDVFKRINQAPEVRVVGGIPGTVGNVFEGIRNALNAGPELREALRDC